MVFTFTQIMFGNFKEEQAFDLVLGVFLFFFVFSGFLIVGNTIYKDHLRTSSSIL